MQKKPNYTPKLVYLVPGELPLEDFCTPTDALKEVGADVDEITSVAVYELKGIKKFKFTEEVVEVPDKTKK